MSPRARPAVVDVLEPAYRPLFDRLVERACADQRVRALWLSGSLARGDADRASDLDVIIAVRDEDFDTFCDGWREWLTSIAPPLIARELPFLRGSFYSVLPGRERLDVVVERAGTVAETRFRHRLLVFDRDNLSARVPPPDAAAGHSPARIAELVEEFFRDYGMFPVVVQREDWLLGVEATHLVRHLLYQLFVEANAPLPQMGVKQWSAKLTPEQRRVLEALPTGGASREEVISAHEAVSCAFVSQARSICSDLGVAWPHDLERATRTYLRSHDLPALDAAD